MKKMLVIIFILLIIFIGIYINKKNIGNEVEVLLTAGTKLTGVLKSADENGIVLTVAKQVKPEGAKRKVTVEEDQPYTYQEIKYTKYLIRFK